MIKWLAHRRFNYIDASFSAASVAMIAKYNWIGAIITFLVGVVLSVLIEEKARK